MWVRQPPSFSEPSPPSFLPTLPLPCGTPSWSHGCAGDRGVHLGVGKRRTTERGPGGAPGWPPSQVNPHLADGSQRRPAGPSHPLPTGKNPTSQPTQKQLRMPPNSGCGQPGCSGGMLCSGSVLTTGRGGAGRPSFLLCRVCFCGGRLEGGSRGVHLGQAETLAQFSCVSRRSRPLVGFWFSQGHPFLFRSVSPGHLAHRKGDFLLKEDLYYCEECKWRGGLLFLPGLDRRSFHWGWAIPRAERREEGSFWLQAVAPNQFC